MFAGRPRRRRMRRPGRMRLRSSRRRPRPVRPHPTLRIVMQRRPGPSGARLIPFTGRPITALPATHRAERQRGLGRSSRRRTPPARAEIRLFGGPAFGGLLRAAEHESARHWDLVEDRLYKIRHGMDITGALRQLSLFAPPIDPMMLVEATAAGLSLDDVQSATSGNVPPYRFTYLIEKARQYASQVQGFGGALLSAIEKRDAQRLGGAAGDPAAEYPGDDHGDQARRRRSTRRRTRSTR